MSASNLCFLSARELTRLVRAKEITAVELLESHLEQFARVNPTVNAVVTLAADQALERARSLDEAAARRASLGPLHGLPMAVKDLEPTRGIRTTYGSRIYERFVPEWSALFVERLEAAGAVVFGKTNTPEFGAGSQTFNTLFGRTRNPYDLTKTCGGSSGGAAVALACGMVPLADGSDLGGSLRNPAAFCNVVGFRPSPGRVPRYPVLDPWNSLNVLGPMARSVADVGLLLSVMAGPDPRDPIAISEPGGCFRGSLERDFRGTRIAWSPDLDSFPVASEVVEVLESNLTAFSDLGCEVEQAHPDFRDAAEAFQTLRAHGFAMSHARDLEEHREMMKDTVVWNVEKGLALGSAELLRAERDRGALFHRVREFMDHYEFLLLPVAQVLPFSIEDEWVREIDGVAMETYIDWMKSCSYITLTSLPALAVPGGFSRAGLPVGLQIVGRYRREMDVLRLGQAFEKATGFGERRPPLAL